MLIAIMQMMEEFCTDRESKRLRLLARGKPIVTLPYMVYTDDTSGNKTKKWNKFDVCCVILAGLPRKANAQLRNIHFVCCSNKMSILDMSRAISAEMNELEDGGVEVYDAFLGKNILLLPRPLCFICDNPRASEISSHLGSSAKKYCRKCKVTRRMLVIVAASRACKITIFFYQKVKGQNS